MITLKGIAAWTGVVVGRAYVYRPVELAIERWRVKDTEAELFRLRKALEESKEQLCKIHVKAQAEVGEDTARIFEAHLLILDDPALLEEVRDKIEKEHLNAGAALSETIEGYAAIFEAMEDEYMRARAADVRDVGRRVLRNLGWWRGAAGRALLSGHRRRSRSDPLRHGADEQGDGAWFLHCHGRHHLPHSHHGSHPGHPRCCRAG
ncbi:MAG: hypothetical protein FJ014_00545 [Chloroflexi bacterium]|nr:hypothetical protein [Chloroflexota bacterium]